MRHWSAATNMDVFVKKTLFGWAQKKRRTMLTFTRFGEQKCDTGRLGVTTFKNKNKDLIKTK